MKVIGSDCDGDVVKYLRHFFIEKVRYSPHAVAYGVTYISSRSGTVGDGWRGRVRRRMLPAVNQSNDGSAIFTWGDYVRYRPVPGRSQRELMNPTDTLFGGRLPGIGDVVANTRVLIKNPSDTADGA